MERTRFFQHESLAQFQKIVELHIAAHQPGASRTSRPTAFACTCAGATTTGLTRTTWRSTRSCPPLYQARVGALSLELANPRHQHEYKCSRVTGCRRRCSSCPA